MKCNVTKTKRDFFHPSFSPPLPPSLPSSLPLHNRRTLFFKLKDYLQVRCTLVYPLVSCVSPGLRMSFRAHWFDATALPFFMRRSSSTFGTFLIIATIHFVPAAPLHFRTRSTV